MCGSVWVWRHDEWAVRYACYGTMAPPAWPDFPQNEHIYWRYMLYIDVVMNYFKKHSLDGEDNIKLNILAVIS